MHLLVLSAFRPDISDMQRSGRSSVSMHLLVLSAFRQDGQWYSAFLLMSLNAPFGAQCFPTWDRDDVVVAHDVSQCTFWCSVLSDIPIGIVNAQILPVSMHLLVLSAFRLSPIPLLGLHISCLNAPFGAQCFPTWLGGVPR